MGDVLQPLETIARSFRTNPMLSRSLNFKKTNPARECRDSLRVTRLKQTAEKGGGEARIALPPAPSRFAYKSKF